MESLAFYRKCREKRKGKKNEGVMLEVFLVYNRGSNVVLTHSDQPSLLHADDFAAEFFGLIRHVGGLDDGNIFVFQCWN